MSDDEPKDESTDESEQQADEQTTDSDQQTEQSEEQPTDSDQAAEQSDEQPTESDQPAEQSDEQPAESDQPADQSEEQPAESDQPADQSEEQPAESDQAVDQSEEQPADSDQSAEQAEEQPADSDQPATAASADNTLAFAGGEGSPGGGGGPGVQAPGPSSKRSPVRGAATPGGTKVQVTAIFMSNAPNSSFKWGWISMNVFGGAKGNLLWKLGSINQPEKTYQDAGKTSNVIRSGPLPVLPGDNVTVELFVALFGPRHNLRLDLSTAAIFKVPADGTLTVVGDVESTNKEFTVGAKDEVSAVEAARRMLTSKEEMQQAMVESAVEVGAGRFIVDFWIPTKRITFFQPKPLKVTY